MRNAYSLGVRARHSPPTWELAPWSAGRGATDPHGGAQAIKASTLAHVNGCVRRTAAYASSVGRSHTPDLRSERSPLAAGWGTRPLVERGVVQPMNCGVQARIQAHVSECARRTAMYACGVWDLGPLSATSGKRTPHAAGWGTRPLVARAWCDRRASRGSGKNTSKRETDT